MLDNEIRQFRDDLVQMINSTPIPVEVKRLVLVEVLKAVSESADNYINSQRASVLRQLAEAPEENATQEEDDPD